MKRSLLNPIHNSNRWSILVAGVLALFVDSTNASDLRDQIPLLIENGRLAEADSLIGILVDRNDGTMTEYVLLLQLRANLRSTSSSITSEQQELLDSLIAADPLGAWSAKATLSFLYGRPYKRIPWMLNDTILGPRAMSQMSPRRPDVLLKPNPASTSVEVISREPIRRITLRTLDGRRINGHPTGDDEFWTLDLSGLASGCYEVVIEQDSMTVTRKLLVMADHAP